MGPAGPAGPSGPTGPVGPPGPTGSSAIIPYAAGVDLAPAATPAFLGFGVVTAFEDALNWVAPRPGTLRNFRLNVITNTLSLATAVYTLRISTACNGTFADTVLTLTLAPGTVGCFISAGPVAVGAGDRVSLQATVPFGGLGVIRATGGVEFA